jgi:hypothetical protein
MATTLLDSASPSAAKAPDRPYRTRNGASDYLGQRWGITTSPATLAKLACVGGGPSFVKFGRTPLYADPDLDA